MGSVFSKLCPDDNNRPNNNNSSNAPQQAEVTTASMRTRDGAEEPLLRQQSNDDDRDKTYSPRESGISTVGGRSTTTAAPPKQQQQPTSSSTHHDTSAGEGKHRNTRTSEVLKSHKSNVQRGGSAAKSLKEYELLAFLGQGSFAEVTLARHKSTRQLFAIKKISKRRIREAGSVEQTFTERQILASLKHPFLVRLHQAFQSATDLYFVLQFAHGGDFRTFLQMFREDALPQHPADHHRPHHVDEGSLERTSRQNGCLPLDFIFFYAVEVAIALIHLHEHGFIYRDLKPENILMQRDGHVMLTDFGVAKQYATATQAPPPAKAQPNTSEQERRENFVGTREYMSPEILQGAPHDRQTDWWSYGCWLHEMAVGKGPFDGARSEYELYQNVVEQPGLEDRIRNGMLACCVVPPAPHVVVASSAMSSPAETDIAPPHHSDPNTLEGAPHHQSTSSNRDIGNSSLVAEMARKDRNAEVCENLMDLIVQLLCRDPKLRLGGPAVLEHPFFRLPCWQSRFDCFSQSTVPATTTTTLNEHSASIGLEAHLNAEKFTARSVDPPYIPRLRGNEDLHCFPCAVSCSESCYATKAKKITTETSPHPGVKPSDELFEFMLSIDGGPTNDSLAWHQQQQLQHLSDAPATKLQHYYDADAATTMVNTTNNHNDEDAPLMESAAVVEQKAGEMDPLVGIAYVVEAADEEDGEGANRWNASQSIQAFNRSPAFDGFSVAFFGSSRPGSMRYLHSHHSIGSSESSMRSPGGEGDHPASSHLHDGSHYLRTYHQFPQVLPRQRSTSTGGGGGSSGGTGGAFANFTYQETNALSA